jgi:hypothetical protein
VSNKFVSPAIASEQLGLSDRYLRELIKTSQDWKVNVHYRDVRSPKTMMRGFANAAFKSEVLRLSKISGFMELY